MKLFDLTGKRLATIGKAGPPLVGPYDEGHMNHPAGCWLVAPATATEAAFTGAAAGEPVLWVAEADKRPKRLSVWTLDGKLLKAFYGPPGYGGGGFLDGADKTRFFYSGMEFQLDWEGGQSKLMKVYAREPLLLPGGMPETPIVVSGRRYLVNTFTPAGVQSGPGFVSVYLYGTENEEPRETRAGLRPAAVVGTLASMRDWPPLKNPAIESLVKGKTLLAWSDLNADGAVQAEECSVSDAAGSGNMMVDPSLRVSTGSGLFVSPTRFTDAGMPVYDLATIAPAVEPQKDAKPVVGGPLFSRDGWLISVGLPISGARSGSAPWTYPQTHAGIQGSQPSGPPAYPGHVIGTTHLAGFNVTPKAGEAGELWTVIGNRGNLFMFTTDGFFVTELFRDRIAAGQGSGPDPVVGPAEATRGLSLREMSLGEEAFWPSITQTTDGNIYLVAGHGFSAICRVTGLDSVKRLPSQSIELTPALVEVASQLRVKKQQAEMAEAGPKTLVVGLSQTAVTVDGRSDDWTKATFVPIADGLKGAVQVSGDRLYGAVIASGNARYADYLTNVAAVDKLLFKGGGALDLQLGVNPQADPKREKPAVGDLRLLVARMKGKPKAMLYRQVVPGTQEPEPFISPVKQVNIDRIDDVSDAVQVAASPLSRAPGKYADEVVYEFSVPLATLGLMPKSGLSLRGDLGVLRGDGIETAARVYWHNKTTTFVSDIPGEVELNPGLWGEVRYEGK